MLYPVMNDAKWDELRLAMYQMEASPKWSVKNLNGYVSTPDREWFYHFSEGGYRDIVYVDIFADNMQHADQILSRLKTINLPGTTIKNGFRVFGHAENTQPVDYL